MVYIDSSQIAYMKFLNISYVSLIQDAILTAQFVQDLPIILCNSLNINVNSIIILSIADSSSVLLFQKRSDQVGILVSMAVPMSEFNDLQALISNQSSPLYDPKNGQLPKFIDYTYPISREIRKLLL